MWKCAKDWIIESLIAIIYLFGIPLVFLLCKLVVVSVDSSVALVLPCYIVTICAFFFIRYIKRGLYAFVDILMKNVESAPLRVVAVKNNSFSWNVKYIKAKRIYKKYFEVYCENTKNGQFESFFSTDPTISAGQLVNATFLNKSKIMISIAPKE